jgi:hypothetical protein
METNSALNLRPKRWTLARGGALLAWKVALLCGVCGVSGVSVAQEIAPFRITAVEGYNTVRYVRDELVTAEPGSGATPGIRSRQGQSEFREELFVMTHSYVYHPNLLSLDIGGGPILQRGTFMSDAEQTQARGALYNFTSRATFLRDKPYQGSVFFEHLNPTVNVAPAQVITQENTRYGAEFSLLAPVTPVPLHLEATRSHFQGSGIDRVIDDQIDRLDLRASRSYGALGSTQVQYQATQQRSMSGSPNLPIQASNSSNQALSVDSRFQFGEARQYDLINLITLNTQAYSLQGQNSIPDRRDGRMFLDLRGRHSKELQSFGSYNYSSSDQGELSSIVNSAAAGLNYTPRPEFAAGVGVHGDENQTKQLTTSSHGADGSLRYQIALPLGVAQMSYALRYDQREQRAIAAQTSVIGERITLTGTTFVALGHQHVSAGSVVVNNATRTQSFVEGSDYVLGLVGAETRLQRLIGGAIVDGQDLLVDYSYDVGGTFAYTQADQTLYLNWGLKSYVNAYFRYVDSEPHLSSGTPSFPLNIVHSSLYGVRADVPLKLPMDLMLGGSLERENRRETIAPYRREAAELYAQAEDPFFGAGNIRVATRRNRVDYENSTQNVNLLGYDLRYGARFWLGVDLSANASYEYDNGALIPRRRMITSVKAQWQYRKLNLGFDLGRTLETQGEFKRSRTLAQALARRDF